MRKEAAGRDWMVTVVIGRIASRSDKIAVGALALAAALLLNPTPTRASSLSGGIVVSLGMSERQVLYNAGLPDAVDFKLSWEAFQSLRSAGAPIGSVEYELTYLSIRKELAIMKGPLGRATQCRIGISKGKVGMVVWTYRIEAGEAAKQALLSDKRYSVQRVGVTLVGSKQTEAGDLLAIVQTANNAETEVILSPRSSEEP